jgi:WD40-like Beta Propeller Repeat
LLLLWVAAVGCPLDAFDAAPMKPSSQQGKRYLMRQLVACLLALLALSGCQSLWAKGTSPEPAQLPGTRLDLPKGDMGGAAWLPDGHVYLNYTASQDAPLAVWRVRPGQPAEHVTLPELSGCPRTDYLLPHALPDGRLGTSRSCRTDSSGTDLVAYDPASGRLEVLAPMGHNAPTGVSWRRDLQSGYVSTGSGICDGVAPLTRQGPGAFPGPVTLDGHTWRLDEVFRQSGDESCDAQGRAFGALLTPDERRLVFFASPQAQGHGGQVRTYQPVGIYIWDLPEGKPRAAVRGFDNTVGMAMSPDGRRVAIGGRRGKETGLWLVDLDSGAMHKLARIRLASPAFSPDGRQLAVVYQHGKYEDFNCELRVLDVPAA